MQSGEDPNQKFQNSPGQLEEKQGVNQDPGNCQQWLISKFPELFPSIDPVGCGSFLARFVSDFVMSGYDPLHQAFTAPKRPVCRVWQFSTRSSACTTILAACKPVLANYMACKACKQICIVNSVCNF